MALFDSIFVLAISQMFGDDIQARQYAMANTILLCDSICSIRNKRYDERKMLTH